MRTKILENKSILVAVVLILSIMSTVIYVSNVLAAKPDTIDICHATGSNSNPYIKNSPDKTADAGGHDGHIGPVWFDGITGDWGDIIPPFNYDGGSYPGKNWTAEGQDIWNLGDCKGDGVLPVDLCSNIDGVQETIPEGYEDPNQDGVCTEIVDVCTNIEGNQESIPEGYEDPDEDGVCTEIVDVCTNLEGNQETIPEGYEDPDEDGVCTDIVYGCTDPEAENYDQSATQDDESCEYEDPTGFITVEKVVENYNEDQIFQFDASWLNNLPDFGIVANGENGPMETVVGTRTITEIVPDGWSLVSATCSVPEQGESSWDGIEGGVSVELAEDETVTCVFTNTIYGCTDSEAVNFDSDALTDDESCEYNDGGGGDEDEGTGITVRKATNVGTAEEFEFDPSWTSNFFLSSGEEEVFDPLEPGIYSVEEVNIPNDWQLDDVTCIGSEGAEDPLALDLVHDETIICTFTNITSGGGGGSSGSRSGGSSSPEPEPEVLGEQTEILPASAPNTGFGGAAAGASVLGTFSTLLGLLGLTFVRRKN